MRKIAICIANDLLESSKETLEKMKIDTSDIIIVNSSEKEKFDEKTVIKLDAEFEKFDKTNSALYPPPHELAMMQHMEDMRYSHLSKAEREAIIIPVRTELKIQRNELCSCGSGKKFKKCCGK